ALRAEILPRRLTVRSGDDVTVNCTYRGGPVREVRWLKDNKPLQNDHRVRLLGRLVLHISSFRRADTGMYQCFVNNEQDSAQGHAYLRIEEVNLAGCDSSCFRCSLHFETSASLQELLRSFAEIHPTIREKFIGGKFKPRSEISLKCQATGSPLPQLSWLLDASPLPETRDINQGDFVQPDGALVVSFVNITSMKVEYGGDYTCMATNDVGTAVHTQRINVEGDPYIRPMKDITVVAGKELNIKCPAAGDVASMYIKKGVRRMRAFGLGHACRAVNMLSTPPPPYSAYPRQFPISLQNGSATEMSWGVGGSGYADCGDGPHDASSSSRWQGIQPTNDAYIHPVQCRNGGRPEPSFHCYANCVASAAMQDDRMGPKRMEWGVNFVWADEVGADEVGADERDALAAPVHWISPWGSHRGGPDNRQISREPRYGLAEDRSSLSIHEARKDDAGLYTCIAKGYGAKNASRSVMVTVVSAPQISPILFSDKIHEGMRAMASCNIIDGDQPMRVSWWRNGQPLRDGQDQGNVQLSNPSEYSSFLTINNVTRAYTGNYTCVANNNAAVSNYTATLLVKAPPRWKIAPRDMSAIMSTSITFDCQAEGEPDPVVRWKYAKGV
ncbi:Down syndrome cell adhesion molecule protein Dscam2-like, partial [Tropilaelaps mercedesae]